MRANYAALFILLASSAHASVWEDLSAEQIETALSGQALDYGSAWQEFRADGSTLYRAGSESRGYWRVEGDQYCSQWPPRSEWACYDVQSNGQAVRFVGSGDDVTTGTYAPKR